jgi:hypothetical protein
MDPFCVNLHAARAAHPRLNGVLPPWLRGSSMTSAMSDCSTMTSTRAALPSPLLATHSPQVLGAGRVLSRSVWRCATLASLVVPREIVAGSVPGASGAFFVAGVVARTGASAVDRR